MYLSLSPYLSLSLSIYIYICTHPTIPQKRLQTRRDSKNGREASPRTSYSRSPLLGLGSLLGNLRISFLGRCSVFFLKRTFPSSRRVTLLSAFSVRRLIIFWHAIMVPIVVTIITTIMILSRPTIFSISYLSLSQNTTTSTIIMYHYRPRATQPSPARPGPARPSRVQLSPAKSSQAKPSPAQPSQAQPSPAQPYY